MDVFIQIVSGSSIHSRQFSGTVWTLVVVDEVHQLDFYQVVAVVSAAQFMVLLYDKAQKIVFLKQSNKRGQDTKLGMGDFYSWERAVHGGSGTPPWACVRPSDLHQMIYTWRFW